MLSGNDAPESRPADSKVLEILRSLEEELLRSGTGTSSSREIPGTLLRLEKGDFFYAIVQLPRPIEKLSEAQQKIAVLAARGLGNQDIARQLGMKRPTVATQLMRIYRKLQVHSRVELASRWPWYA